MCKVQGLKVCIYKGLEKVPYLTYNWEGCRHMYIYGIVMYTVYISYRYVSMFIILIVCWKVGCCFGTKKYLCTQWEHQYFENNVKACDGGWLVYVFGQILLSWGLLCIQCIYPWHCVHCLCSNCVYFPSTSDCVLVLSHFHFGEPGHSPLTQTNNHLFSLTVPSAI